MRDCKNCPHYRPFTVREIHTISVSEDEIYGCEEWECTEEKPESEMEEVNNNGRYI